MKRFSATCSSKSQGLLRRHCLQQAFGTDDSHDPLHVVGEHLQTHLQQDRRVVRRSAGFGWNDAIKTQRDQVEFIGEDINHPYRVGIADVLIEALGKQGALPSVLTLDKPFHGLPLQ